MKPDRIPPGLVRWLVALYPADWRRRYGEEFTLLLADEWTDGTLSPWRMADVARHGIWTRWTHRGWAGEVVRAAPRAAAMRGLGLALLLGCVVPAAGVWAQLGVGWQWAAPGPGVRVGIATMFLAGLGAAGVGLGLALGLILAVLLTRWRAQRELPWATLALVAAALLGLWLGSTHIAAHWPGTGGHAWPGRGLLPASPLRLAWAATLWISAYWVHPAALGTLGPGMLLWMVLCPIAEALLAIGVVRLLRGSGRWLTSRPARAALWILLALMLLWLAGAVMWLSAGRPGPDGLFGVGAVDVLIVAGSAGCLTLVTRLLLRSDHLSRNRVRA